MKFTETNTLMQRGAIEQLPDTNLSRIVMVGEDMVGSWEEEQSQFGYDTVQVYPTVDKGKRGFMLIKKWCAEGGYCAEGTEEVLISLEEGARLLLRHGAWTHLWKD